jgi:hypothetical protein
MTSMASKVGASPADVIRRRDKEVAEVRAQTQYAEDYKAELIRQINEEASREYAEAREAERRRIQDRLESTKKAVFEIPTGYGSSYAEEAHIHHLFRAALSEVKAATENPESAQKTLDALLDQAALTGDHLLGRAVYHHAIALGDRKIELSDGRSIDLGGQKIVDRYLAGNPVDAKKWEAYAQAQAASKHATSFEGLLATGMMDQQFTSQV